MKTSFFVRATMYAVLVLCAFAYASPQKDTRPLREQVEELQARVLKLEQLVKGLTFFEDETAPAVAELTAQTKSNNRWLQQLMADPNQARTDFAAEEKRRLEDAKAQEMVEAAKSAADRKVEQKKRVQERIDRLLRYLVQINEDKIEAEIRLNDPIYGNDPNRRESLSLEIQRCNGLRAQIEAEIRQLERELEALD